MSLLDRRFRSAGELFDYLREQEAEEFVINELQRSRPLRDADQMFRKTTAIDGKAFLSSVVMRADGSVEVWMRRFLVDEDQAIHGTTHEGFELVAHLRPQEQ